MPGCFIIPKMNRLIAVVGVSGVGKTALVDALSKTGKFVTDYEQHVGRPFQELFKHDKRYALANQVDYHLRRAEQERMLRSQPGPSYGLMDGGLDLDFHGFTRLFHKRGLLREDEYDLCRRLYEFFRETLPQPELFVHLWADEGTVAERLSVRKRINIASAEDTALFHSLIEEWLASIPAGKRLELDVSHESVGYKTSVNIILEHLIRKGWNATKTSGV